MRAIVMREFGPPSVLVIEEVPDPAPAAGQVLIDVVFANITFVETQLRAGAPPNPAMLPAPPVILGNGVGGVVAAVGDGVPLELMGKRVVASLNGTGGYAERAIAAVSALIDVPDGVRTEEAVALLADGRTALSLMRAAQVQPGEKVLVEAAAGGVGHLLVQLARNAGAQVIGAAGGERKLTLVRDLGATMAVDYSVDDWVEQVRSAVGGVDVVFDGVGGRIGQSAFQLLQPGGRFCPFGMASGAFAAAAHTAIENRATVGKTLLEVMRITLMVGPQ